MIIKKSENGWELCKIANRHLSCDNFILKPDDIDRVEKCLAPKYGKIMKKEHIMVSYDNWSGIFIMQMPGVKTDFSDNIINEIYDFLSNLNLGDLL